MALFIKKVLVFLNKRFFDFSAKQLLLRASSNIKKAVSFLYKYFSIKQVVLIVVSIVLSIATGLASLDHLRNINKTSSLHNQCNITKLPVPSANQDISKAPIREEKLVILEEEIPYKSISKADKNLSKGEKIMKRKGKNGIRQKTFKVVLEDGKEISKDLVKCFVVRAQCDELISYGTLINTAISKNSSLSCDRILTMSATAYTASCQETGKRPGQRGFGITRSGIRARRGVIAVDPKVIPLGTKVYIQSLHNTEDYGYAIAADTGSAIRGNKIDVFFENLDMARKWGRRTVKVHVGLR